MMGSNISGLKLDSVFANTETTGFCIRWFVKGTGYGEFTFRYDPDSLWHIDNEYMGKEFIKSVLCAMVDAATLDDGMDGD